MTQDFNPSSFAASWAGNGDLVVDFTGADPDGVQTVTWRYASTDGSKGTNGSVNGPYAQDDGTAHVIVAARHFPGNRSGYSIVASQTLGPAQTPA